MFMKTKMKYALVPIALSLAMVVSTASAQQQGVSKDEIVLGTIQDLSGPLAGFGKQSRLGMH
jgi:branched-chain amino acid transport system substrate-binding protein